MPANNKLYSRIFDDRHDAGKKLAEVLLVQNPQISFVFGLPRGGIVTAYEIACAYRVPLHTLIVRKIGSPFNQEFGIGAIAEGGIILLDTETIRLYNISRQNIDLVIGHEKKELLRRKKLYRHKKRFPNIKNKTIVIVDDGVATGYTAYAAIRAVRKKHPQSIIFATPVCAVESYAKLQREADIVVCLSVGENLRAIGRQYRSFPQVTDKTVLKLLFSF